jgi:hypothetical protein
MVATQLLVTSTATASAYATDSYQLAFGQTEKASVTGAPQLDSNTVLDASAIERHAISHRKFYGTDSRLASRQNLAPPGPALSAADPPYDPTFYQECQTNPAALATGGTGGWVKNHFYWCERGPLVLRHVVNGTVQGTATLEITLLGVGANNSRTLQTWEKYESVAVTGDISPDARILSGAPCISEVTGSCDHQSQKDVLLRLSGLPGWVEYRVLTSDATAATSVDSKILNGFSWSWEAFTPSGPPIPLAGTDADLIPFRCDSASYMSSPNGGCIFTDVLPFLSCSAATDPDPTKNIAAVAQHIYHALTSPADTYPEIEQVKQIPGGYGIVSDANPLAAVPVHRLDSSSQQYSDNRGESTRQCRIYFPGYAALGLQCDEFPFASTVEGAASGGGYSVSALDGQQNGNAGNQLGTWYGNDRILHEDSFWVQVTGI